MIILVNVVISNKLDNSTRNKILAFHSEDIDAKNNISFMADMHVTLNEFLGEEIVSITVIKPINVSCNQYHHKLIGDKLDFNII